MTTKHKTFKDYYDNDDEFRKKHLKKLNEKVECECGAISARSNLYRHRKSHLHIQKMGKADEIAKLTKQKKRNDHEIEKLTRENRKISKQLKKLNKIE